MGITVQPKQKMLTGWKARSAAEIVADINRMFYREK